MDILLNDVFMMIVFIATSIAFIAYSAFVIRKHGAESYLRQLRRGSAFIFLLASKFIMKVVGLLAQSAKTKKFGKESDISPSGGALNYRTGKLDDGTDPVGWYEKD